MMRLNSKGFTLIELMIAVAISGIIIAGIITTFVSMRASYYVQDEVSAMQQNLRAGFDMMAHDIRAAGYDPSKVSGTGAGATIALVGKGRLRLTMDLNGDGDVVDANEDVTYGFSDANDATQDGIADSGAANLARRVGVAGAFNPLAEYVHAVGFAYAFDDDGDGELDQDAGGNVIWAIDSDANDTLDRTLDTNSDGSIDTDDTAGGNALAPAVNKDSIVEVRIWILARSENPDEKFTNNRTYVVGANHIAVNDGFRRRLLQTTFRCRNMGL